MVQPSPANFTSGLQSHKSLLLALLNLALPLFAQASCCLIKIYLGVYLPSMLLMLILISLAEETTDYSSFEVG
jgi:hypothetical protein